jgi:hypothetical protein
LSDANYESPFPIAEVDLATGRSTPVVSSDASTTFTRTNAEYSSTPGRFYVLRQEQSVDPVPQRLELIDASGTVFASTELDRSAPLVGGLRGSDCAFTAQRSTTTTTTTTTTTLPPSTSTIGRSTAASVAGAVDRLGLPATVRNGEILRLVGDCPSGGDYVALSLSFETADGQPLNVGSFTGITAPTSTWAGQAGDGHVDALISIDLDPGVHVVQPQCVVA